MASVQKLSGGWKQGGPHKGPNKPTHAIQCVSTKVRLVGQIITNHLKKSENKKVQSS